MEKPTTMQTATEVILDAIEAAEAAKDTNTVGRLKKELVNTSGALSQELSAAIQEGPDEVERVLKSYGLSAKQKSAERARGGV